MSTINWFSEAEKRKELIVQHLQSLLQIESVLDEATAADGKPFGAGVHEALIYLLEQGEKHNFSTKNVDGYAGVIEHGQGEESVGVLVHIDVVPAGDGWTSPPFKAEVRNGRMYARGAIDDKGPAIAAFFAMTIVKELLLPLNRRIQLIIGTDEESEWRCVDHYFKKEEMPTVGFVPDADFPIIIAEKGIADVTFQWKHRKNNESGGLKLVHFHSGERFNMVPDLAEAKIEGKQDLLEKIAHDVNEKLGEEASAVTNEGTLNIIMKGKAVHGSTPEKGRNAGLELASFLASYSWQQAAKCYLNFLSRYVVGDTQGVALGVSAEDEVSGSLTINAGLLQFDQGQALAGLNVRYPVTVSGQECLPHLRNIAEENGAEFSVVDHMEPSYVDKDHSLVQTLQAVYERQMGEKATLLSTGGGTYARALRTGVAFGALFPGREDVAHQRDEYIEIDDLLKATALYAEAMYELAK